MDKDRSHNGRVKMVILATIVRRKIRGGGGSGDGGAEIRTYS